MTDIPIIFSAQMIRALLDGRKTMTRRLAWGKRHKAADLSSEQQEHYDALGYNVDAAAEWFEKPSPWQRVKPGDRLWVRETWCIGGEVEDRVCYRASEGSDADCWRSPIHMARAQSRITLVVTATKIERLQDISERDAIAEGCPGRMGPNPDFPDEWDPTPAEEFRQLWIELHGAGADANPEVVALTFTVQHRLNAERTNPQ